MKLKKKWAVLMCIMLIFVFGTEQSYGEKLNGFSDDGKLHAMLPVLKGLDCNIGLKLSTTLGNSGQILSMEVLQKKVTGKFMASSTRRNKTAFYTFDRAYNPVIYVDDKSYNCEFLKIPLSEAKSYSIKARMTFRWQTTAGKALAGFPRYYYRTVYTETKMVTISDIDGVLPELPEEPEEDIKLINGEIAHTDIWEERRKTNGRAEDYYWPGEKILLRATVESNEMPMRVEAAMEGTPFRAALMYNGSYWQGELLDKSMLELWAGKKELEFGIVFKAYFADEACEDLESVVIDDSNEYWLLHRKE